MQRRSIRAPRATGVRRSAALALAAPITLAVALGLTLAACSNSGVTTGTPLPATATTAPGPTIDPQAQAAVTAWHGFLDAISAAERHPYGLTEKPPAGADVTPYTWDPARFEFISYIAGLKEKGTALRGTPNQSHVTVKSVDLKAKPLATVTLSDCLTGSDWTVYYVKTGKPVPKTTVKIPPPYPATITVILNEERWGVQKVDFDYSRTCTA